MGMGVPGGGPPARLCPVRRSGRCCSACSAAPRRQRDSAAVGSFIFNPGREQAGCGREDGNAAGWGPKLPPQAAQLKALVSSCVSLQDGAPREDPARHPPSCPTAAQPLPTLAGEGALLVLANAGCRIRARTETVGRERVGMRRERSGGGRSRGVQGNSSPLSSPCCWSWSQPCPSPCWGPQPSGTAAAGGGQDPSTPPTATRR